MKSSDPNERHDASTDEIPEPKYLPLIAALFFGGFALCGAGYGVIQLFAKPVKSAQTSPAPTR